MNGCPNAAAEDVLKSAKIVYTSGFRNLFIWLLAAFGDLFMTAITAFGKLAESRVLKFCLNNSNDL